jgi:chromosome partitioning protein
VSRSVVAVFNQKHGVGKTTTAVHLLACIARRGLRPLGIDLDPQAHLSGIFDALPHAADESMYSFFVHRRPLDDVARITPSGVAICPAHLDLGKLDALLGKGVNAITRLRVALRRKDIAPGPVVIDCCAQPGVLSLNALFACDLLLVPISADYLALEAAQQVDRALRALEPVLKRRLPRRYLLTRFDERGKMSTEVAALMALAFRPEEISPTRIAENASFAEGPAQRPDVFRHAPAGGGAADYEALVDELMRAGLAA